MKRLFLVVSLIMILPFVSEAAGIGKVKKVVIDAGHGGKKPGAVGKKSKEKDITLAIALKLGKLIEDNCKDVDVIYTRTTDVDVDLFERAHIANRNKADLFISIHVNSASPRPEPVGTETYVMGLSQSLANLEVAKKENADILLEDNYEINYQGFDPYSPESHIMFALYQNAFIDKSLDFAAKVQKQFGEKIKTQNRGVKQAGFLVLYKTAMPSVLIEVGFLSNPNEEAYLSSAQGQGDIALSIFNAFREYKSIEEGAKPSGEKVVINLEGYNSEPAGKSGKNTSGSEKEKVIEVRGKEEAPEKQVREETIPSSEKATVRDNKETKATTIVVIDSSDAMPVMEKAPIEPKSVKEVIPVTPATQEPPKLEYRVQFYVSKEKLALSNSKFKNLEDIRIYEQDGTYRYTSGNETNVEDAKRKLASVQDSGFKDAFIIAFYNNKRITLQEALNISKNKQ